MNEFNPYAPPESDLSSTPDLSQDLPVLADRGTRLGASMLDGFILVIPMIFLMWGFYALFGFKFLVPVPGLSGILLTIGVVLIGTMLDLAINGTLLLRYGQTVGKKICKIKIVKLNGDVPSLMDSFVKRRFIFTLAQQVPFIGGLFSLIDALMIFRKSCRCLHDEIAGTIVVKA
ncbi:MAG: RDD family protein [Holophagaceae bacterium]|nr:RDD family protein [Holophagaceae bacterium]